MEEKGFTLVELVVVMAIAGVLLTIATLNWSDLNRKAAIEKEAKTLYTDLMAVRLDSLYTRRGRSVVLSGTQFNTYSSNVVTAQPLTSKTLRYPLKWTPASTSLTIDFDASGMVANDIPICVDEANNLAVSNSASVDSLLVSAARMKLGKRQGGVCDSASIVTK